MEILCNPQEAAGLSPNEIKDPKESIKQGVKHFYQVLTYGTEKRVDFPTDSFNLIIWE